MAGKKRKVRRLKGYTVKTTINSKVKSKGFPTIADLVKTVPKGGLLDPSLRRGVTGRIPTAKEVLGR